MKTLPSLAISLAPVAQNYRGLLGIQEARTPGEGLRGLRVFYAQVLVTSGLFALWGYINQHFGLASSSTRGLPFS